MMVHPASLMAKSSFKNVFFFFLTVLLLVAQNEINDALEIMRICICRLH